MGATSGRRRWCAIVVAGCLLAAGSADAQPCLPLGCPSLAVADGQGFDFPDPDDFQPDRRPGIMLNLFGGSCWNPPSGGPQWWQVLSDGDANGVADAVDELLLQLDSLYDEGWRRIILKLPAGALSGYLMASSQWWAMPPVKREDLSVHLRAWIHTHPDATVGIYSGFRINDPCRLCMAPCETCSDCGEGGGCTMCPTCDDSPVAHVPDTASAADMCIFYNNVAPWIALEVYEIWFDAAGGANVENWDSMLRLAGNPDYRGRVRFAAEPLIVAAGPGWKYPVFGVIGRIPFVSSRRYYAARGAERQGAPWTFDAQETEIHVMLRSDDFCVDADADDAEECTACPDWCQGPEVAIDVVHEYIQRGYIPVAASSQSAGYVRRILDIDAEGVACPADLDVDGIVDMQDVARLSMHLGMSGGATLYHGDVDLDDDVDVLDYLLLVAMLGTGCG